MFTIQIFRLLSPANSSESLNIDKWREELQQYSENVNCEDDASFSDSFENGECLVT